MTQVSLAYLAGVSPTAISTMERDSHEPTLESAIKVVRALKTSFSFQCKKGLVQLRYTGEVGK